MRGVFSNQVEDMPARIAGASLVSVDAHICLYVGVRYFRTIYPVHVIVKPVIVNAVIVNAAIVTAAVGTHQAGQSSETGEADPTEIILAAAVRVGVIRRRGRGGVAGGRGGVACGRGRGGRR